MTVTHSPLIVGAGPVGLGAALFLAEHGEMPRIIDVREEPSEESRALAVNPRTLEILEPSGVTQQMVDRGLPIHGVRFYRKRKPFAELSFYQLHAKYPWMLALSQATTEKLLAAALERAGGHVERGKKLVTCESLLTEVVAGIESSNGDCWETVRCPWLLAADGAHSAVRDQLGLEFTGSSLADEWSLVDVPLQTALAGDFAHVFFLADGAFVFAIRVVDDSRQEHGRALVWRVLGNRPHPLDDLADAEATGPPIWSSSFRVSHRIVAQLASRHVYFAGDAAHIHSPIGARGMNLGLEDAWVFAKLVRAHHLTAYAPDREIIDRKVVRQVEFLSKMAAGVTPTFRFVRRFLFPLALRISFVRTRMIATITGLDHPLPPLP